MTKSILILAIAVSPQARTRPDVALRSHAVTANYPQLGHRCWRSKLMAHSVYNVLVAEHNKHPIVNGQPLQMLSTGQDTIRWYRHATLVARIAQPDLVMGVCVCDHDAMAKVRGSESFQTSFVGRLVNCSQTRPSERFPFSSHQRPMSSWSSQH